MKEIIPIIILNYNSFKHVKENIESAMKYSTYKNIVFKFIVIDNNSNTMEKEKLKKFLNGYDIESFVLKDKYGLDDKVDNYYMNKLEEKEIIYIQMEDNFGFSYSNNIGLKIADFMNCKYCIIANPDTRIIDEKSVENLYLTLEKNEDIAIAFPRVIDPNGLHQEIFYEINFYSLCIYNIFYPLLYIPTKILRYTKSKINTQDNYIKIYTSIGCFFMIRLSDMKKVGFMDENMFMYYEEDVISIKMRQINKKLVCVNNSVILHKHIISRKQENTHLKDQSFEYFLNKYLMYNDLKIRVCKFGIKFMNKLYAPLIDKINKS